MRLRIISLVLCIAAFAPKMAHAQLTSANPLEYVALAEGHEVIYAEIDKQIFLGLFLCVLGLFRQDEGGGGQVGKSEVFADSGDFPVNRTMFFGEKDIFTSFFRNFGGQNLQ